MKKLLISILFFPLLLSGQNIRTESDSACIRKYNAKIDSLAKMHLSSIRYDTTKLTRYQRRAYASLRSFVSSNCVITVRDTIISPPTPVYTVSLTSTNDTIFLKPKLPFNVFVTAKVTNTLSPVIEDSVQFSVSDTTAASFWWNKIDRRLEIFNLKKADSIIVTGKYQNATTSIKLIGVLDSGIVVPPDTIVPPIDTTGKLAELPKRIPLDPVGVDTRPCTVIISQNLQQALNSATPNSVICLAPGSRFTGNFTVPARSDTSWVVIRTDVTLPTARLTPSLATSFNLARISSPNTNSTLTFVARSTKWYITGVEITSDSSISQGPVALIQIGTALESSISDLPHNIILDRIFVHGWPSQHVRRALAANGGAMTLRRSWCEEIHASGFDSQCSISWNAVGPYLIEDNNLAAASENIMFGGADPKIPGAVISDVIIRKNYITKSLSWKSGNWNVKNLIETKASARVLVEENILDGAWADGQLGYAFVLKSTSQNNTCAKCSSYDWTIRRNLIRNTGAALSIAGRADQRAFQTDSTNRRFDIVENWFEPVNVSPFTGDARQVIIMSENYDIRLRNNVFEGGPGLREGFLLNIANGVIPASNLTISNNIFHRGQYGLFTSGKSEGLVSWLGGTAGVSRWENNVMVGNSNAVYPTTTIWQSNLTSALSVAGISKTIILRGLVGIQIPR